MPDARIGKQLGSAIAADLAAALGAAFPEDPAFALSWAIRAARDNLSPAAAVQAAKAEALPRLRRQLEAALDLKDVEIRRLAKKQAALASKVLTGGARDYEKALAEAQARGLSLAEAHRDVALRMPAAFEAWTAAQQPAARPESLAARLASDPGGGRSPADAAAGYDRLREIGASLQAAGDKEITRLERALQNLAVLVGDDGRGNTYTKAVSALVATGVPREQARGQVADRLPRSWRTWELVRDSKAGRP